MAGRVVVVRDGADDSRASTPPKQETIMASQSIVVRARTLQLPEALDATVTATLIRSLSECRGEDVVIDASYVERFTVPCARALGSAARKRQSELRSLTFVGGAVEFSAYLQNAEAEPVTH